MKRASPDAFSTHMGRVTGGAVQNVIDEIITALKADAQTMFMVHALLQNGSLEESLSS